MLPADKNRIVLTELDWVAQSQQEVLSWLEEQGARGRVASIRPLKLINAIAVEADASVFDELQQFSEIGSIEEDPPIEFSLPPESSRGGRRALDSVEPGLRLIRAPEVWHMGITGAGVIVSHCDVGVNGNHPALQSKWRGSYGYPASQCWFDQFGGTSFPTEYNSHGTMTMGIICGMVPGDTVGVAWGARWISSALNMTGANQTVSTAIAAFQWLANPDGDVNTFDDVPRVCSNSWGIVPGSIPPCYDVLNAAVDNLEAAGVAVVFAAGNEYPLSGMRIPADRSTSSVNCFAVGAWNQTTNNVWASSCRGPSACSTDPTLRIKPEVVAPGVNIRSSAGSSGYASNDGTSFSVAMAAGVLALMAEANPALNPDSLKKILMWSAVDKGARGNEDGSGYGVIDAVSAVQGAIYGVGWVAGYVTGDLGAAVPATFTIDGYPHTVQTTTSGYFCFPMPAQIPIDWRIVLPSYDLYQATTVFAPGDTIWSNVSLSPNGNGVLQGSVIDCQGSPAVNSPVDIVGQSGEASSTDFSGRFQFSLPAGSYVIHAADGFCADGYSLPTDVIPGGIVDVEVVLPFNPSHICSDLDNYGYRACDSYDAGGPEYRWIEVSPTAGGKGVIHNLGDDGTVHTLLPFPVSFYGVTRQRIFVNGNGFAIFNSIPGASRNNMALPTTLGPAIFAAWDDYADNNGGDICSWYELATHRQIIEYYRVPRYSGATELATFQIQIMDPEIYPTTSGNAIIEVHYEHLDNPSSSTFGIDQSGGSGNFVQYGFDGGYPVHATPVEDGMTVRYCDGVEVAGTAQIALANPVMAVTIPQGESRDTSLVLQNLGGSSVSYLISTPADTVTANYSMSDSRAGGPEYVFNDISVIGENTGIASDDSLYYPFMLPWVFKFYDRYFDRVGICTNGYLGFVSGYPEWQQVALTLQRDPYYLIAPYWRDLMLPNGDPGRIYTYFDQINDCYVVQYDNVRWWESSGNRVTMQVVLWHDGRIDLVYEALSGPLNQMTAGVKGRNLSQVQQLAYNSSFITSNCLIRFTPPIYSAPATCQILNNQAGVIAAGGSISIPVRLTNSAITFGSFDCGVVVQSSDAVNPSLLPSVLVQNAPSFIDAGLVARHTPSGIVLSWRPQQAAAYSVYSGPLDDSLPTHWEATVTDTFVVLPYTFSKRKFEIRLSDETP